MAMTLRLTPQINLSVEETAVEETAVEEMAIEDLAVVIRDAIEGA